MQLPPSLWPSLRQIVGSDDPHAFVQESVAQGLVSLLLAETPPDVADALRSVRAMHFANRKRTELLADALRRLATLLDGEEFAILKGLDYAYRIYPDPVLRQMSDIDILVPPERMQPIDARLRAAGVPHHYVVGPKARVAQHHEQVYSLGDVTLEVHQSFIAHARHRIDYRAIWNRRVPFEAAGVRASRLSDEDALLYHALSLTIKELDVPLVRYLDFYLLLTSYRGDLSLLAERAKEWRMARAWYAALRQTVRVFPELDVDLDLLPARTRRFLDERVLPSPLQRRGLMTRRQQLWRKWHLMDGYRERLGFLAYHGWAEAWGRVLALRSSSRA